MHNQHVSFKLCKPHHIKRLWPMLIAIHCLVTSSHTHKRVIVGRWCKEKNIKELSFHVSIGPINRRSFSDGILKKLILSFVKLGKFYRFERRKCLFPCQPGFENNRPLRNNGNSYMGCTNVWGTMPLHSLRIVLKVS